MPTRMLGPAPSALAGLTGVTPPGRKAAASEKPSRNVGAIACVFLLAHGTIVPAFGQQLPTGGAVAAGNATIAQPNANTLNINQSTNQAILNWQSFSVGQGGTVNFNQPNSSSATLNRVLGSTPSSIAGAINAPGTVLLVNPNGIAITKSGVINTGSFAASTLNIKDADFLAGNYKFTGNGGSAAVTNAGRINVSDGGFAALLGGQVANSGVISARLGKVGLGAGELITLDFAGDGFLSVAVPSTQLGKLVDQNGALVTNSGKIRANGGQVFLSAATASTLLRDAVNVPGSIRANTVGTREGKIVIGGGAGGKVNVSGRLAANGKTGGKVAIASGGDLKVSGTVAAKGRDGKGGEISITSADVQITGAMLDVSGTTGGGTILIGGDYQGGGTLARALTTTVDAASVIRADAIVSGDGGKVILWSDKTTNFAGQISARGGAQGGNGGFAEVSGKETLSYTGFTDLRAAKGRTGTLLLDPSDIIIDNGANDTTQTGDTITGNSNTSHLNVAVLNAALSAADVIVDASGGTATGSGSITLSSGTTISSNAGHALTLNALTDITLNGSIFLLPSTVSFVSSGGGLVQVGGGLFANTVVFNVAGPVTLNSTVNNISGSTSAGNIVIGNHQILTVTSGGLTAGPNASVTVTNDYGISVGGAITGQGGVTLTAGAADGSLPQLVLGANVSAANGNVVLKVNNGSIQQVSGVISAIGLAATTTKTNPLPFATDIALTGDNAISTFAANAPSGSVAFRNTNGLTVGSVGDVNGITAQGPVTLTANGAITVAAGQTISRTGTGTGSIRFNATDDIIVNAGATIAQTTNLGANDKLNIVFNADSDANGSGRINLDGTSGGGNSVTLSTNGGNITLGGRDTTLTGAVTGVASGNATNREGVRLSVATLNAGDGSVKILGQGGSTNGSNHGVFLTNSSVSANGGIELSGNAGSGNTQGNDGVIIANSQISSTGLGSITVWGTATANTNNNLGILLRALRSALAQAPSPLWELFRPARGSAATAD